MIGKIVGGLIAFVAFHNIFGVILGVIAGHFFDLGRRKTAQSINPETRARIERALFEALFPLLGHLAKADGHISEDEIRSTEELIARMGLNEHGRAEAIRLFQTGKSAEFDFRPALSTFAEVSAPYADVKRIFLVYLLTLALADGVLHENEEGVLREVSKTLGFSDFLFNQLIGMVRAQAAFRQKHHQDSAYHYYRERRAGNAQPESQDQLKLAYEALGVAEDVDDAELKKTYRRLMSENHPDKLSGQGVPEEMIKLATERSQKIQAAYDLIKKSRKN